MIQFSKVYNPLYLNKDKFIILLTGGRGSGKSFCATTFTNRLSFQREHIILYCRYTMSSAKISVIPEFREKIELDNVSPYFQIANNDITNTFSGSKILFRGIKTSSGNQTANLKSIMGITTFVGDEMEEWRSEEDYEKLMLSIRKQGVQLRIILILNPTDSEHFIYKKYIENTHKIVDYDGVDVQISTHPDVLHIHTTYLDNTDYLHPNFIHEVEKIKAESIAQATDGSGVFQKGLFNKTKYAQTVIGRWADVAEGVIFNDWEIGDFDPSLPYAYGQDFGFSVDPDTLIKVAIDPKKRLIYVEEKYCNHKQLSTDQLAALNKKLIDQPHDLIIADSAEPRLIEDLRKKGLNIKPCIKGQGSVSAGITAMLSYKIVVAQGSLNVVKELKNYQWNEERAGIPRDLYNHTIDAIRYAFTFLTSKPNNHLKSIHSFR